MNGRMQCVCKGWYFPKQEWAHEGCAAKYGVANTVVANGTVANAKAAAVNRVGRYADPEKRKAYMRELMRKRRAEGRA